MDLAIHDEILWCACVKAAKRLAKAGKLKTANDDPRVHFPWMVRGSWMNDMNQVSPLIDFAQNPDIRPQQNTLFQGLWKANVEELLTTRIQGYDEAGPLVTAASAILTSKKHNIDGFGDYIRFDHLDITNNIPAPEYDGAFLSARFGRASTAHYTVNSHVSSRLTGALLDERLEPACLTSLGRGLHTIADVFAHSNYVELLLWSLAWRGKLDADLLDAFNHDDGSNDASKSLLRCPLPMQGAPRGNLLRNAVLWYGDSPESTPFVSALFDTNDTIFSLLHIYAAHLERTDGKPQTGAMLDVAMAIFDIQGAPLIKAGWAVLETIGSFFAAIGQGARNLLANGLDAAATRAGDQRMRDVMHSTAFLVRKYDSEKAKDWAQAGRLKFLARELQLQMLEELKGQTAVTGLLPHHTLLAKDHVGNEASGIIRFKLACLLATEISARLIEQYFSEKDAFSVAGYRELANRVLIHPWQLLDANPNLDQAIAPLVKEAGGAARWQKQAANGLDILGGVL